MLELMKKYYEQLRAIKDAYDVADDLEDEGGKEVARTQHREWKEKVISEGEDFWRVFKMYEDAKDRGNEYIDLHDVIWDRDVPALIERLRKAGIDKFTFSSTWSSAVETAWLFVQNGCKLEGLTEIYGTCTAFMSDEYERVPAYVFSIT